jgi:hypothetical protein
MGGIKNKPGLSNAPKSAVVAITSVDELDYTAKNKQILDFFADNEVEIGTTCIVIDIRPTKTKGKSSLFCVSSIEIGGSASGDFDKMSMAERLAQGFASNSLMRGRITFSDELIKKFELEKGAEVSVNDINFTMRVYESREPFYAGQKPVGFTNDKGVFEPRLVDGEPFFRDTKVVTEQELESLGHQLTVTSPSNLPI